MAWKKTTLPQNSRDGGWAEKGLALGKDCRKVGAAKEALKSPKKKKKKDRDGGRVGGPTYQEACLTGTHANGWVRRG